jgi:hypothetical protein
MACKGLPIHSLYRFPLVFGQRRIFLRLKKGDKLVAKAISVNISTNASPNNIAVLLILIKFLNFDSFIYMVHLRIEQDAGRTTTGRQSHRFFEV